MSQHIITVNFEDFLRTGIFGDIKFGFTSDQIQILLGAPDFVFTRRKSRKPTGFEYGDIEFYFDGSKENRLNSIYLDHFKVPQGSKFLSIDAWCLRAEMSESEVEFALTQANIGFMPTEMPDSTMNGIVTLGGVVLGFIKKSEEFSPPSGLYNIGRSINS